MKKFFSFMLGVVVGGILGGTLALLLAPTKGNELRTRIQDYVDNLVAEAQVAAAQRRTELENELARLRKQS
ncbi:MAG TPA: YtxH domain-containing protein [Longilinea sp.]|nr:YtxH domain-containing protein [Longilinea sp.]